MDKVIDLPSTKGVLRKLEGVLTVLNAISGKC